MNTPDYDPQDFEKDRRGTIERIADEYQMRKDNKRELE
jgi:hypothetical protein